MHPSTAFLYTTVAFTFFASATARTYTSGTEFFNDLPQCIKDCYSQMISEIETTCANSADNIRCVCQSLLEHSDSLPLDDPTFDDPTTSNDCASCSAADVETINRVSTDFVAQCTPYFTDNSTVSAPISATSTTATPSGNETASVTSISATVTSNLTVTPGTISSTAASAARATATQSNGAASSLLVNTLFVIAVPVVVFGLFM